MPRSAECPRELWLLLVLSVLLVPSSAWPGSQGCGEGCCQQTPPRLLYGPNPMTSKDQNMVVSADVGCQNPFSGASWTRIQIRELGSGRRFRTLIERRSSFSGVLFWDGRDDRGRKVPSGVYSLRWEVPGDSIERRVVFLN